MWKRVRAKWKQVTAVVSTIAVIGAIAAFARPVLKSDNPPVASIARVESLAQDFQDYQLQQQKQQRIYNNALVSEALRTCALIKDLALRELARKPNDQTAAYNLREAERCIEENMKVIGQ